MPSGSLVQPCQKDSFVRDKTLYCINESCNLEFFSGIDKSKSKLFSYNVHYFDYLFNDKSNKEDAREAIKYWLENCDFYTNISGHAYPTSLRIVNWIKWKILVNETCQEMDRSLGEQVGHLINNIENDILGNHYFSNAKALIFYGIAFDGELADRSLKKGLNIFYKEIEEQVLNDGANFELSPMYHGIMLEDVLDLINLSAAYGNDFENVRLNSVLNPVIEKMLQWLKTMTPPTGEYLHFNDSTQGVAPSPNVLEQYAYRLGFSVQRLGGNILYPDSGYCRMVLGDFILYCNASEMGPAYIPGHAHADTLSFELWVRGVKFLGNLGTSLYGLSERRFYERGTSSHSTVVINNTNSSQVWSGFRVAKRANVVSKVFDDAAFEFEASHNGYKKLGMALIHSRKWILNESGLVIVDSFETKKEGDYSSYFHLHPDVQIDEVQADSVRCILYGHSVFFTVSGGRIKIVRSEYANGLSVRQHSFSIIVEGIYKGETVLKYKFGIEK